MALCPKLSPVLLVASCVTLSFLAFATPTQADTITSYTAGIAGNSTFFSGQSFTTPGTGPWDDITFNFFSSGGTPQAVGTLYLLTQPYAGTPAGLSGAVSGFLASTSSIVSNQWVFNPSVMLQSNTQYFAFMDSQTLINGSNSDAYSGGSAYLSSGGNYAPFVGDANFTVNGTPAVPEPSSVILLGAGLAGIALLRRRFGQ